LGAEPSGPDFGDVVDGVSDGILVNHVMMFTSGAKTYRTRATSLAVLLLLPHIFAVVAVRAAEQDIGVGTPPALAPGQAPALAQAGTASRAAFIKSSRLSHCLDPVCHLTDHAHACQSRVG
jgi:hypothetical protein